MDDDWLISEPVKDEDDDVALDSCLPIMKLDSQEAWTTVSSSDVTLAKRVASSVSGQVVVRSSLPHNEMGFLFRLLAEPGGSG